jgi:hypothetical protein
MLLIMAKMIGVPLPAEVNGILEAGVVSLPAPLRR